ncbi:MAG: SDR family NAD(P)-dependent oxidoreductase [Reichenbachiella sp.]
MSKTVLILGANSDVAKQTILQYVAKGYKVLAASRSTDQIAQFVADQGIKAGAVEVLFFDAVDFDSHQSFYDGLSAKPNIVLYAAGFLVDNLDAIKDWKGSYQMMNVHYAGAVSIINIIVSDEAHTSLERIVGLSSLSGVRGRKSNFIYGSTKSAFTQYLAGMRQHLSDRNVKVNVIVAGYIRSKMTEGLDLEESLMLEPSFVATAVVEAGSSLVIVPGFKWKIIYHILSMLPEFLVAKLP